MLLHITQGIQYSSKAKNGNEKKLSFLFKIEQQAKDLYHFFYFY